jgi:hypothetical protein
MSKTPTGTSRLVRVTVTSGSRRVDLALAGAVPVAELVPELARCVGLLDAVTVYGGYRLVTQDGRALAPESGLICQGIEDGEIITVAAGVDDEPPRRYDDVVEAMTDVVARDVEPWDAAAGRRTALWFAVLLLLVGAASLLIEHGSGLAAVAVAVAVALVLGAVGLSRTQGGAAPAVVVAMMGCVYAAVAGLMVAWGTPFFGSPVAAAGGSTFAAGLVAAVGLTQRRALLMAPVMVGAVFLATGLLVNASRFDPAVLLTTALALVLMGDSAFPWLALGATGTSVDQLFPTADNIYAAKHIDVDRVAADARIAHEFLLGASAAVGVLVVLVSPMAVSLGVAGTVISVLACVLVMLRTRRRFAFSEVLVGLTSGVLGLVSTALSVLWLHPAWRPGTAVGLAVAGVGVLALAQVPPGASVRRRHLGDVVESLTLLGLPPALVVATGVLSVVRG